MVDVFRAGSHQSVYRSRLQDKLRESVQQHKTNLQGSRPQPDHNLSQTRAHNIIEMKAFSHSGQTDHQSAASSTGPAACHHAVLAPLDAARQSVAAAILR